MDKQFDVEAVINTDDELHVAIAWCQRQAEEIMGIAAGCAMTHGDPCGGLEMCNRLGSDIAINLEMIRERLSRLSAGETGNG